MLNSTIREHYNHINPLTGTHTIFSRITDTFSGFHLTSNPNLQKRNLTPSLSSQAFSPRNSLDDHVNKGKLDIIYL